MTDVGLLAETAVAARENLAVEEIDAVADRGYYRRRESTEHPFGTIKQWMGQGTFLTRRLNNVRGEFSLTALAYNMRRAINLVGIPALIAAAEA